MVPHSPQSALHTAAGSPAALIDQLATFLYTGGMLIFVFVMALALIGVLTRERRISPRLWILGGGLAFPLATLSALLTYSLAVGDAIAAKTPSTVLQFVLDCLGVNRARPTSFDAIATDDAVQVHVVGKQWWWEVRYRRAGQPDVVLANELHIPMNTPIELTLSSTDVIHSFWAPSLAGKVDMVPGRETRLRLQTHEPGVFRGQCAEYCGGQHALMAFYVIAQPSATFAAWLEQQSQPAVRPQDPFLQSGYDAFFKGNCHECHTVRGTPAQGTGGPDLTHVGSRRSLAAGVLSNHIGTMAGWIAGTQDVKPGNLMPASSAFTGTELRAVATWLGSLQ